MLRRYRPGQLRRKCPTGYAWPGEGKPYGHLATELGIAKERAKPIDDVLQRLWSYTFGLTLDELDGVDWAQGAKINLLTAEALAEKLPSGGLLAINRCVGQALLVPQVVFKVGCKIPSTDQPIRTLNSYSRAD